LPFKTLFIDECLKSDLIIDFSGDMWGDNANFLGKDRFLIGLIKDRVAQLLNKKTVMIAGSPGPFKNVETLDFAKEVYSNFDLVTNRESISVNILNDCGFDTSKTKSLACPAFLFEPCSMISETNKKIEDIITPISKPIVGFILCGWNFTEGPYDKWPREDSEYTIYAEAVEYISEKLDCHVLLLSHSNGFISNKTPFELIHGRDYLVSDQLNKVLKERGIAKNFSLVTDVLDTWQTKALVGEFDMLVSGRIHGAVAGLSQSVPTVIIDYGHEPKAHKLRGFAIEAGVEHCIANPVQNGHIISKIEDVFYNLDIHKERLDVKIPLTKQKALKNFKLLSNLITEEEVYNHLLRCNGSFKPQLSTYVDIKKYSNKITNKSLLFKKYDKNYSLIGLIAIYDNESVQEGYLTNFSIDPIYIGKGIGTSLLSECVEYFKSLNYNLIRLEVFNINDRALGFYKKEGFEVFKKSEDTTELILKL
jgi:colanic acid/amylovoran biosynthesis protein